jgi:hypothetical protein
MGGTCDKREEDGKHYRIVVRHLQRMGRVLEWRVCGIILLKWILNKYSYVMDWIQFISGWSPVVASGEHANEPSDSSEKYL